MNENFLIKLKELEKLPIFKMSLSSKELFHSNFIAWILETYPDEMGKFFSKVLNIEPIIGMISNVKREKHDIDISFNLDDILVLIENKVKSIAYKEQLDKYDKFYEKRNKKCILLSLKKPTFEKENWQYLEYSVLLQQFEDIIKNNEYDEYHKYLIKDYIKFINILLNDLLPIIDIEKIQISKLYQKNTYENNLLDELTNLRMHDFFLKGVFEDMANSLKNELEKKVINFQISNEKIADCNENTISITFGMSRSQGILDIKYKIRDFYIGIQIQGDQYRQFIEGPNVQDIPKISKELLENKQWFQFSNQLMKKQSLDIYPIGKENKEFNKFGSSNQNWLFFYRSIKITSFNNKDLFEMICQDINDILEINNLYKREIE